MLAGEERKTLQKEREPRIGAVSGKMPRTRVLQPGIVKSARQFSFSSVA